MQKKRKVDREALSSPFMRIPGMRVEVARDFIDLGLCEVYELAGRSPEALYEDLVKLRRESFSDRLAYLRMAVYYAETPSPERSLMAPSAWMH